MPQRATQRSTNAGMQPAEKPRGTKNDISNFSELMSGTSRSGSASSSTPEGEAVSTEIDTTNQVSVFLSFNRQVFSRNAAVFTYYRSDITTSNVLAYTVSEAGELFEADLEGTLAPQTHVVVYVQSAIATNSARVRLTLLRPSPTAHAFLASFAQDDGPPNQTQSRVPVPSSETVSPGLHGAVDGITGVAPRAAFLDDAPEVPHEAVERVIYLDAEVVLNREPLTLLPDPSRTKKKAGAPRGGAGGDGQRGKSGVPQGTKTKSGNKAAAVGGGSGVAAPSAGNTATEKETKAGGVNNRDYGRGGAPAGGPAGAATKAKKAEKSDGVRPDSADENKNNSSLEVNWQPRGCKNLCPPATSRACRANVLNPDTIVKRFG